MITNIGRFTYEKKVNVETSRAKYAQFIFGNAYSFKNNRLWKKILNNFEDNYNIVTCNYY